MSRKIEHNVVAGLMPVLEPRLLPENCAQIATDVDMRSGKLSPIAGPLLEKAGIAATTKSIYKYRQFNKQLHKHTSHILDKLL